MINVILLIATWHKWVWVFLTIYYFINVLPTNLIRQPKAAISMRIINLYLILNLFLFSIERKRGEREAENTENHTKSREKKIIKRK